MIFRIMASTLHQMCKDLEKCAGCLEVDVRKGLEEMYERKTFNENEIALESSKDYHYKEILSQLRQIKEHIKIIADHNQCIQSLQNKINGSRIDKNYIKKQVESFQNLGVVHKREKLIKPRQTSSMELLERWEKIVEEQEENQQILPVRKREHSLRKTKKCLSSTVDTFLERSNGENHFTEERTENAEDINEEVDQFSKGASKNEDLEAFNEEEETEKEEEGEMEKEEDEEMEKEEKKKVKGKIKEEEKADDLEEGNTKPRIVDVIYKKSEIAESRW